MNIVKKRTENRTNLKGTTMDSQIFGTVSPFTLGIPKEKDQKVSRD